MLENCINEHETTTKGRDQAQIESSSTSSYPAISKEQQLFQDIEFTESESQPCAVSDKSFDVISPVPETQLCPNDGITGNREIGRQSELLVEHISISKPMTACIATKT